MPWPMPLSSSERQSLEWLSESSFFEAVRDYFTYVDWRNSPKAYRQDRNGEYRSAVPLITWPIPNGWQKQFRAADFDVRCPESANEVEVKANTSGQITLKLDVLEHFDYLAAAQPSPLFLSIYDPHTGEHRIKAYDAFKRENLSSINAHPTEHCDYGKNRGRQVLAHHFTTDDMPELDDWIYRQTGADPREDAEWRLTLAEREYRANGQAEMADGVKRTIRRLQNTRP